MIIIGYGERFFRVEDSLAVVSMAVIGGLGSLAGAVTGALWVVGLPAFWPNNETVPLLTSSIGLLIVLLYIPGGFTQIGYWVRGMILRLARTALAGTGGEDRDRAAGLAAPGRRRAARAQRRRQHHRDERPDSDVRRTRRGRTTSTSTRFPAR